MGGSKDISPNSQVCYFVLPYHTDEPSGKFTSPGKQVKMIRIKATGKGSLLLFSAINKTSARRGSWIRSRPPPLTKSTARILVDETTFLLWENVLDDLGAEKIAADELAVSKRQHTNLDARSRRRRGRG